MVIPHTADTATIRITTTLNEGAYTESWGISDVVVEYYTTGDCDSSYDDVPTV